MSLPKNPDPSKIAILRARTPAIQVRTHALEGPKILRVGSNKKQDVFFFPPKNNRWFPCFFSRSLLIRWLFSTNSSCLWWRRWRLVILKVGGREVMVFHHGGRQLKTLPKRYLPPWNMAGNDQGLFTIGSLNIRPALKARYYLAGGTLRRGEG